MVFLYPISSLVRLWDICLLFLHIIPWLKWALLVSVVGFQPLVDISPFPIYRVLILPTLYSIMLQVLV